MSRIKAIVVGLLAVLVVSAVASASASASGPYVYTQGGSSPLMEVLEILTEQIGNAKLNGTLAGSLIEIVCGLAHGTGSLHNELAAGTEHALGSSTIHYTMCSVAKPAGKGCLVQNELVLVQTHALGVSGPLVRFDPETGKTFTTITIDGCSASSLNGAFPVEGFASAKANNGNSTLEFTTSSGSELLFAGNTATFVGTYQVEMKGGGLLEIK